MKKVLFSTTCALALLGSVYSNVNNKSEFNQLQLKNVEALADELDESDSGDVNCCIFKTGEICYCYYLYVDHREASWPE